MTRSWRLGAAVVAALALCSARSRAEIEEYSSHVEKGFEDPAPVVSLDGYHFASVHRENGRERLFKDAEMLAEGDIQSFSTKEGDGILATSNFPAALSADGRVLIHSVKGRDQNGAVGWGLGVNGSPKGKVYPSLIALAVSEHGSNLAVSAMSSPGRYSIITPAGEGPAFGAAPDLIGVTDESVLYRASWNGRYFLYRDNAPLPNRSYDSVAASPDLRSIAGAYPDGNRQAVELNGHAVGSWPAVSPPAFGDNGRDLIFLAKTTPDGADGQFDAAIVNGAVHPIATLKPADGFSPAVRPSDGAPFVAAEQGTGARLCAAGRMLPDIGALVRMTHWVAFSRSGAHWAVFVQDEKGKTDLIVDGKAQEGYFLSPIKSGRLVFDTENEYHYLGDSIDGITLVCGALKGPPSPDGTCVRYGTRLDKHPSLMKAALPALRVQ